MIAGHYVVRFRAQLNNETDPGKRITLRRLLIEEEDRLGATFGLLAEVQQIDCKQRIAELRYLVGNMRIFIPPRLSPPPGGVRGLDYPFALARGL